MGIRNLWRIAAAFIVALIGAGFTYGQENAIGGSVRTRKDVPLAGVKVHVAQKPSVYDQSREKDGVYLLSVPKSLTKIDLIYECQGYLKVTDTIKNEQEQNKRPIITMRENDPQSIGELRDEELTEIVATANRIRERGKLEAMPAFVEMSEENLKSLSNAASSLRLQGRRYSSEAKYGEAEARFTKALVINQTLNPNSWEVAQTMDDYAYVLEKTNRGAKAAEMTTRALSIRAGAYRNDFAKFDFASFNFMADPTDFLDRSRSHWVSASMISKAEEDFVLKSAASLPNLDKTTIPLFNAGGQFGKLSVASGQSQSFKVYVSADSWPFITILGSPKDLEFVVADENGAEITKGKSQARMILWVAKRAGTYTVTVSNPGSQPNEYVLGLSNLLITAR